MMTITKRQLLKTTVLSVAGLTLPYAVARPLSSPGLASPTLSAAQLVVGDSRYAASALFADRLAPDAWFDTRYDAAVLWYQQLGKVINAETSITGMTTSADLSILRGLARDSGLRLRWQQRDENPVLVAWTLGRNTA